MINLRDVFSLRERNYGEADWIFIKGGWWWRTKVRELLCFHSFGILRKTFILLPEPYDKVYWTKLCSKCDKRKNVTPKVTQNGIWDKIFSKLLS
ncbi:hypothetical protein LCGC14_1224740 [marine sediment metagenome]|uniref:Uncharacterized protein n=1 Tax=marine sediment metagenome TaxID=412755 RepID=A0A0F9LED2_9ZZZZ